MATERSRELKRRRHRREKNVKARVKASGQTAAKK